jgi:hypothetical protein
MQREKGDEMRTEAEKTMNFVVSKDIVKDKSLKEIFEEKSISAIRGVKREYGSQKVNGGVELTYKTKLLNNKVNKPLKHYFYFPDFKETVSFIHTLN